MGVSALRLTDCVPGDLHDESDADSDRLFLFGSKPERAAKRMEDGQSVCGVCTAVRMVCGKRERHTAAESENESSK